uniref:Uncharacterized protein n=1 Tax=Nitzschia sp. (in: diatoms) TaxID=1884248 RepID=A0A5J6DUR2_9STRA|nr:hypothetical protein [Nitzschia sp. (in: diatoms)]QES95317.1 hypothetical protein [Nitzschia sp. (in: diatoms)]
MNIINFVKKLLEFFDNNSLENNKNNYVTFFKGEQEYLYESLNISKYEEEIILDRNRDLIIRDVGPMNNKRTSDIGSWRYYNAPFKEPLWEPYRKGYCDQDIKRFRNILKRQKELHLKELEKIAKEKSEYLFRGIKVVNSLISLIKENINNIKRTFKLKLFVTSLLKNTNSTQSLRLLAIIYMSYDIKRYLLIKKNNNKNNKNNNLINKIYYTIIILRLINILIEIKFLGMTRIKPIKNTFLSIILFEGVYQGLFFLNKNFK